MGLMLRALRALAYSAERLWVALATWWNRPSFQAEAMALLREMSAVTRQQATTAERMAGAMEQLARFYVTSGTPETWVSEDDNEMLIEMLTREMRDQASGPEES